MYRIRPKTRSKNGSRKSGGLYYSTWNNQKVNIMCDCHNVAIGSYKNQVCVNIPPHMEDLRRYRLKNGLTPTLCIDRCLLAEIQCLWNLGVVTTGCCCGHNVFGGYIGVSREDIPRMKRLGYRVRHNHCRPGEDSFYPKESRPAPGEAVAVCRHRCLQLHNSTTGQVIALYLFPGGDAIGGRGCKNSG